MADKDNAKPAEADAANATTAAKPITNAGPNVAGRVGRETVVVPFPVNYAARVGGKSHSVRLSPGEYRIEEDVAGGVSARGRVMTRKFFTETVTPAVDAARKAESDAK